MTALSVDGAKRPAPDSLNKENNKRLKKDSGTAKALHGGSQPSSEAQKCQLSDLKKMSVYRNSLGYLAEV